MHTYTHTLNIVSINNTEKIQMDVCVCETIGTVRHPLLWLFHLSVFKLPYNNNINNIMLISQRMQLSICKERSAHLLQKRYIGSYQLLYSFLNEVNSFSRLITKLHHYYIKIKYYILTSLQDLPIISSS